MKKNDSLQIVITWGLRKRTLKECTETLIVFLESLKRFDPRFGVWYEGGLTKKEALKTQVILDYNYIKNTIETSLFLFLAQLRYRKRYCNLMFI